MSHAWMCRVSIAAGVFLIGVYPAAGKAGTSASGDRTIRVHGTLDATEDAVPDTSVCLGPGHRYTAGPLDTPYSGTSIYRGTFRGTGKFCGYILPSLNSDGSVPFAETDVFSGRLVGCGRGTITYTVRGSASEVPDLRTLALPAQEDWRVARGTGSHDLSGITRGHGHDPARINADTSIHAEFRGVITCHRVSG